MKNFQIDDKMREILDDILPDFPYVIHKDETKNFIREYVPWHWHEEVEFTYVLEGTLKVGYKNRIIILEHGDGVFTNSNTLHTMCNGGKKGNNVVFYTQIIQKSFLGGRPGSIWERRYLLPLLENREVEYCIFRNGCWEDEKILAGIRNSSELGLKKPWGYEFELRNILSGVWIELCHKYDIINASGWKENDEEDQRIKKMMGFIQENYDQSIHVEQIAKAADVSARECFRCFERNLSMTPFHYLMQYRVLEAADRLIRSNSSITEIGLECGFQSNSYFTKIFKQYMNCTPSQYRKIKVNGK